MVFWHRWEYPGSSYEDSAEVCCHVGRCRVLEDKNTSRGEKGEGLANQAALVWLHEFPVDSEVPETLVPPVRVRETICIPGRTEAWVRCVMAKIVGAQIFEPSTEAMDRLNCLIPKVFFKDRELELILRITNLNEGSVTLFQDTVIGSISPVERAVELEADERQRSCWIRKVTVTPTRVLKDIDINPDLDQEERGAVMGLPNEYADRFADKTEKLGSTGLVKHVIDTGDHPPVRQRLYARRNPKEREIIAEQVEEMLAAGIIEPSSSPYGANVVLAKKKDGKLRFCVDYTSLNAVTKYVNYPLPKMSDILDSLGGAQYFSTLDCESGYWQIEMHPDSKDKTAIVCEKGSFVFNRMPFGLALGPATFQRLVDTIFHDIRYQGMAVYLDDIVVMGTTLKQHNDRLRTVLEKLRVTNHTLKATKCKFAYGKIHLLGHVVNREGIKTDPAKVQAIAEMPPLTTVRQLRSFLGMCNFYRKFVKGYSVLSKPLTNLLKAEIIRAWGAEEQEAFEALKKALT